MGRTIEFEGRSTQEALDAAVDQTGISLSSLKFEVVNAGGGGIFGISLKKAKIRVFLEDEEGGDGTAPEEEPLSSTGGTPESGETPAPEEEREEAGPPPSVDEPPRSSWAQPSYTAAPAPKKLKKVTPEDILQPRVPAGRIDLDLREAGGRPDRRRGEGRPRGRRGPERPEPRSRRSERGGGRGNDRPSRPEGPDQSFDQAPVRTARPRPVLSSTPPEGMEAGHLDTAREVLSDLLSFWMPEAQVEAGWRDDKIYLDIKGDSSGLLIGRKGQTLDALQFLVGKIVDRKAGRHLRLMVDTEDYRSRREESLERAATQLAEKALKSGKGQMTGPMNPHDRRIVHLALQEDGRFKTRSRGEGTYKRVIISLKD